jgi:hypothetical protein
VTPGDAGIIIARGFSEKLLTYALGRRLITDEPEWARIRETAMKDQFRFQTLILAFVDFPLFHIYDSVNFRLLPGKLSLVELYSAHWAKRFMREWAKADAM